MIKSPMKPVDTSNPPFALPPEIVLDLPKPPSTNGLFFNSSGGGRARTAEYRSWLTEAGWAVRIQRQKNIKGPVKIGIAIEDAGKGDLDNFCKATCDLLVKHGLIEGDDRSIVRLIGMEWSTSVTGCRVIVRPA